MTDLDPGADYFDHAYRDYHAQNPNRKLDHYLDVVCSRVRPGYKELLDIGCGLGSFLARAGDRYPGWRLSGSDVDPIAVATTSRLMPEAEIVCAGGDETPFPDASFDVITAWDVLEHVSQRDSLADSVTKMLRPGGLLAFVVPVYDGIIGPIVRHLDKDPTHVHKQSRDAWVAWAHRSLDGVEWHGLVRYLVGKPYLHLPTRRLRRLAPAILVTGYRR